MPPATAARAMYRLPREGGGRRRGGRGKRGEERGLHLCYQTPTQRRGVVVCIDAWCCHCFAREAVLASICSPYTSSRACSHGECTVARVEMKGLGVPLIFLLVSSSSSSSPPSSPPPDHMFTTNSPRHGAIKREGGGGGEYSANSVPSRKSVLRRRA